MTEKRWLLLVLAFCLLLTTGLRFQELGGMVVWHDEVFSLSRVFGISHQEITDAVHDGQVHSPEELLRLQRPQADHSLADTLHSLQEHPEHSPLYYLISWSLSDWADEPIVAMRGVSSVFAVLMFPAILWLGRELVDRRYAWLSLMLAATTPIYFLYAREARQYALWIVLITAASAALLRAQRIQSARAFLGYALLLAIALYTHLMTGPVMLAHGLFLLMLYYRERNELARIGKWVLLAWGLALLAFTPWLAVILEQREAMQNFTGWMSRPTSFANLVTSWLGHVTHLLVDLPWAKVLSTLAATLITGAALWHLRHAPRQLRLFVVALMLTSLAFVILPDLLRGGRRSMEARYLLPLMLSLQLTIAWALYHGLSSSNRKAQMAIHALLILLLGSGLASQFAITFADNWWTKSFSAENAAFARLVNASEKPLIIGSYNSVSSGEILSLAHRLDHQVSILMEQRDQPAEIPTGYSRIFAFLPSEHLRQALESRYTLVPYADSWKWFLASPVEQTP